MVSLLLAVIYLAFIGLGLPDSLLGSGWPIMHREFGLPISYMGVISMIISGGTILSSLMSERLTKRFGTPLLTAFSTFLTAAALFGFSTAHNFLSLCLWSIRRRCRCCSEQLRFCTLQLASYELASLLLGSWSYNKSIYYELCLIAFKLEQWLQNRFIPTNSYSNHTYSYTSAVEYPEKSEL